MRARSALAAVAVATACPILAAYGLGAADAAVTTPPLGPGVVTVELDAHYSRFSDDTVRVYEGTLVRFVVKNSDPIHHEFIVGDAAVHEAHEQGHDAVHPPVPGEVSVDPGETGLTTYLFDEPGTVLFACHLPGHFAYGMKGEVEVIPT